MRTVSDIFPLLLCRRVRGYPFVLRCSELHSHLLSKYRNQRTLPREGAVRPKKKVTVKILSLLPKEKAKSWDVGGGRRGDREIRGRWKRKMFKGSGMCKSHRKTPQDSQCLSENKERHKFSMLFSQPRWLQGQTGR